MSDLQNKLNTSQICIASIVTYNRIRLSVVNMFAAEPERFILREAHWTVTIGEVVRQVNAALVRPSVQPVALPPNHHRVPTGPNGRGLRGQGVDLVESDAEVVALIRRILEAHGGGFNPARISHPSSEVHWMGALGSKRLMLGWTGCSRIAS